MDHKDPLLSCVRSWFSRGEYQLSAGEPSVVLAVDVDTASQFTAKIVEWTASSAPEVHEQLQSRTQMLELYWTFVKAAEAVFTESLSYQMGFARCSKVPKQRTEKSIAEFQRGMAIRALAVPVLAPKVKSKASLTPSGSSTTPLLDQELGEKQKWAARLQAIAERAGPHADSSSSTSPVADILSNKERSRLQLLVLTSGAPATMSNYIRKFEKLEGWFARSSLPLYLFADDKFLKYCLFLDAKECGPSVIPSMRTALRWVAFRINLEIPSLDGAAIKALEKAVFDKRGKPLKEAIPFPVQIIGAMEKFVLRNEFNEAEVFVWWILCMIFASLQFDDAIHVKPHDLEFKDEGLFGISWQTKTERKGRGTKFVVPDVSFAGVQWLRHGWSLFNKSFAWQFADMKRDFWVPDLESKIAFRNTAPDYARALQWAHHLIYSAARIENVEAGLLTKVPELTWPSARVTMLHQGVHFGRTPQEIGVQANGRTQGRSSSSTQGHGRRCRPERSSS